MAVPVEILVREIQIKKDRCVAVRGTVPRVAVLPTVFIMLRRIAVPLSVSELSVRSKGLPSHLLFFPFSLPRR
jgi:hypothetical protein